MSDSTAAEVNNRLTSGLLAHIPTFDGIRGIAILMVLGMHNFGLPLGWIGVDLFFVLSGFLITQILLKSRENPGYFRNFYMRRLLRIFPVYYLTLLAVALLVPLTREHLWWYALYLGNFTWLAMEHRVSSLVHTWSLACEEQFYFIWPLLVYFFSRNHLKVLIGALLLGAAGTRLYLAYVQGDNFFFSYSLFTRSDGLLLGSFMAILVNEGLTPSAKNLRYAWAICCFGATLILVLAAIKHFSFGDQSITMALFYPFAPLTAAGFMWIAFCSTKNQILHQLLCWSPLKYIGKISYGLYLFHMPINFLSRNWMKTHEIQIPHIAAGLLQVLVALGFASLSWIFFERPLIGLKKYFSYSNSVKSL